MRLATPSLLAVAGATTFYYTLSLAAGLPPVETTVPSITTTSSFSQPTLPPDVTFTPNYVPAGITISTDTNSSCSVTLSVTAPNPNQGASDCGYVENRTSYASVTVSTLLVDCLGCDGHFTVRGWQINCPLGRTVSPYVATVTDPVSTFYTYGCSSTSTRTLSAPHVVGPSYTPVGLSVVSPIGSIGPCTATVSVGPTASDQIEEECRPPQTTTLWPQTVSSEVPVDCGGCAKLVVRGDRHGCPLLTTEVEPVSTVSAETATTAWSYACAASPTPEAT